MMRKILGIVAGLAFCTIQTFAQLSDEEYAYITMDLEGILNLTMTTDPQIDFKFSSINEYQRGVIQYNATKLSVDATIAWDLFAYAATDNWNQVDAYSSNGEENLPAEILEIQTVSANSSSPLGGNFNSFVSLKGLSNSGVTGGIPDINLTQFIAGMVGTAPGESYKPGSSKANPETNLFRVHYRLIPGIPASFPNSTVAMPGVGFAQAGYYSLEVIYALVEDL